MGHERVLASVSFIIGIQGGLAVIKGLLSLFENRWNKFRTLCNTEYKVCVVLDLPSDLPEDNVIDRWLGETVRAIFISTGKQARLAELCVQVHHPHVRFVP